MNLASQYQLEYTVVEGEQPIVTAIIVAAGSGTRMGKNKQMLPLLGIPVLARTLIAFETCTAIRDIVVVTKEESIGDVQNLADTYHISKITAIVAGGKERQESVANGLQAVSNDTVYVAIHDGARPLITPDEIIKVVTAAGETGAAALAVPVKDTVKRVDSMQKIIETPLRSSLMAMQTPQVFEISRYRESAEKVAAMGLSVTDDCQVLEIAGYPVYVVEGSYRNLKITTPDDLSLAEILLTKENEE